MRTILGISAFYHDSAAALVVDGVPVAAAQEERFLRKKHYAGFPQQAVQFVLKHQSLDPSDVDAIVFYEKPFLKLKRLISTYFAYAPRGFDTFKQTFSVWLKEKMFQERVILRELRDLGFVDDGRLLFSSHHYSHAASAFFPSPFEKAAILTMDGVGEWATTTIGVGDGNDIKIQKELRFPHSLGLLYSAFTDYTGFKVNSGEYKVMGLAPYGEPRYVKTILDNLIDIKSDGSFRLNMEYFDYCTGNRMTSAKFNKLFGAPPRRADQRLTQREMDLAASIQAVTEEVVSRIAQDLARSTGYDSLCLAGGVALNCVANGKLRAKGIFRNMWIQPAAGDAGGALGAAFYAYHCFARKPRPRRGNHDDMNGSYLGPSFSHSKARQQLGAIGAKLTQLDREQLFSETVDALAAGKAVGWFQGRMEFGPRALGNRSIIADPRSPYVQRILNLKVKYRESFRPFAPSVLQDEVGQWFEFEGESPYMLLVASIARDRCRMMTEEENRFFGIDKLNVVRSEIPAVTHVDYSARLQTVSEETNPTYYRLLSEFFRKTGCPVLVNTSFNVRGEPIVCTPADAFRCFMGTELDVLVVENCVLRKEEQDPALKRNYKDAFELD